jgi:hypothetical protein
LVESRCNIFRVFRSFRPVSPNLGQGPGGPLNGFLSLGLGGSDWQVGLGKTDKQYSIFPVFDQKDRDWFWGPGFWATSQPQGSRKIYFSLQKRLEFIRLLR